MHTFNYILFKVKCRISTIYTISSAKLSTSLLLETSQSMTFVAHD